MKKKFSKSGLKILSPTSWRRKIHRLQSQLLKFEKDRDMLADALNKCIEDGNLSPELKTNSIKIYYWHYKVR